MLRSVPAQCGGRSTACPVPVVGHSTNRRRPAIRGGPPKSRWSGCAGSHRLGWLRDPHGPERLNTSPVGPTGPSGHGRHHDRPRQTTRSESRGGGPRGHHLSLSPGPIAYVANQAHHTITKMCDVLGVSCSGFYDWKDREPSQRDRDDAVIAEHLNTAWVESRRTYGARPGWFPSSTTGRPRRCRGFAGPSRCRCRGGGSARAGRGG
jgi:hypothetical protein